MESRLRPSQTETRSPEGETAPASVARSRGISLVELTIAVTIIVITASSMIGHLAVTFRGARTERDRVFAYNAAQSILSEIHAFAADSLDNPRDIDSFDDGTTTKAALSVVTTEQGNLLPPDHPVSRNSMRDDDWVWSRQISVAPVPEVDNKSLRYVTVRIFKMTDSGDTRRIASVSSIVNGLATSYPTSQVFDVFFLAIENIPGWWVHMESIRPFMESIVSEIEVKNPGLEIRTHWITKAGYGRDTTYRPYINDQVESTEDNGLVYYYPGLMPSGNASTYYYVPSAMRAFLQSDVGPMNGYDAASNPYPYTLADQFNHAMRYPAAKEFHDERLASIRARQAAILAAKAGGTPVPDSYADMSEEPTLQLFLENLNADPTLYKHAVVLNLHGELLPLPAIRNYSDAAKDPASLPGIRVVTHPEELRTARPGAAGATDVRLRVYAYVNQPDGWAGIDRLPTNRPIALQIMDMDLTDGMGNLRSDVLVENLRGGVPVGGSSNYSAMAPAKLSGDGSLETGEMYYDVEFVDPGAGLRKFTLLKLYNTPVICPQVSGRGLPATERARLYGLEYVPSCAGSTADFSRDLDSTGSATKNTARWVITVPQSVFSASRFTDLGSPPTYTNPLSTSEPDRVVTVRTRIWDGTLADPYSTGSYPRGPQTSYVQPHNLSETYTWWADSSEDVPFTERAQFRGDPRHNPYKDLLDGDPDFPNGYNWFFDNLSSGGENAYGDFAGLDSGRLQNLWMGRVRHDLPRGFGLLRQGLMKSQTVFTTLNGYSFYYCGTGNEIGSDSANGYPSSIPLSLDPFGQPSTDGHINTITGSRRFVRSAEGGSSYWWGMPWLGELFDDDVYLAQWFTFGAGGDLLGNLLAGTGSATRFYQAEAQSTYANSDHTAYGTVMENSRQITSQEGCTSFMNSGSNSGTFQHHFSSGTGSAAAAGLELLNNYGLSLPTSPTVNRPFSLDTTGHGGFPSEWGYSEYTDTRTSTSFGRTYFNTSASLGTASAMVDVVNPGTTEQMSIVVNGFGASTIDGVSFIARYCMASALHTFLEAGTPGRTVRTKSSPRVEISKPTEVNETFNPGSMEIEFDIEWTRWDGQPITATIGSGHTENESELEYALIYSRDNGITWLNMLSETPVLPGTRASGGQLLVDFGSGPETYIWSTPSSTFPSGSYVIRIEAYRLGQEMHYAHHQRKVFIQR